MTTPKLALPELSPSQASKELTHNQALAILDQLAMPRVVDKDLTAPPGSPANGALYIVATGGTGAWAGKDGYLAWWLTSVAAWTFLAPSLGMSVRVMDELDSSNIPKIYGRTASSWVEQSGMANPMSAAGDLITGGASGTPQRLPSAANGKVLKLVAGSPAWADEAGGSITQSIIIACSDESSALTTGTGKVTFRMPFGFTLSGIRGSLTTAQISGSLLTVNVKENGTTILSTKLTFDNTEKTTTTAATAPVISDANLADDSEITIDIDQVGDGTAKGLKISMIGVKV